MRPTLPRTKGEDLDTALTRCFGDLAEASALLLAVSGGPDSMALMHLAARWAKAHGAIPTHVATVDHGLRPEARQEAAMVATSAAALGLPHATLPWVGPKPTTGLQEKARAARYDLLVAHARSVGVTHIVTAHHADDQAETVLLRLGRGSGISGLAGMRALSHLAPGLWLTRPLLRVPKAGLVAFCRGNAIDFVEDPSNDDPAFARTRLRGEAAALARLGLDAAGLGRLAQRMARADAALECETDRIEAALGLQRHDAAYAIDLSGQDDLSPEIALRLLRRAVRHAAGDEGTSVRLERLEALAHSIWASLAAGRAHRATLGGTLVRLDRAGALHVSREPERQRGRPRSRPAERPD